MRVKGNLGKIESGWSRKLEPNNWITKILWKFLAMKVILYIGPPEHVNCRCIMTLVK